MNQPILSKLLEEWEDYLFLIFTPLLLLASKGFTPLGVTIKKPKPNLKTSIPINFRKLDMGLSTKITLLFLNYIISWKLI